MNCTILGWYVEPLSPQYTTADLLKADGLKHYLEWAVENGLAVIDANVPKYLTGFDVRRLHPSACAILTGRCRRKTDIRTTIQGSELHRSIN